MGSPVRKSETTQIASLYNLQRKPGRPVSDFFMGDPEKKGQIIFPKTSKSGFHPRICLRVRRPSIGLAARGASSARQVGRPRLTCFYQDFRFFSDFAYGPCQLAWLTKWISNLNSAHQVTSIPRVSACESCYRDTFFNRNLKS